MVVGYGKIEFEMGGIRGSPIVDRVIASMFPISPAIFFYAPELRWRSDRDAWWGVEAKVVAGSYSISVDAMVDGVWIWEPSETIVEVEPAKVTEVSFKLEEKIRLGERCLHLTPGATADPFRAAVEHLRRRRRSSSTVIAQGAQFLQKSYETSPF